MKDASVAKTIVATTGLDVHGSSRQLLVLLHAAGQDTRRLAAISDAAHSALPDADIWTPPLPIRAFLSRSRGADITAQLVGAIRDIVAARASRPDRLRYEDIRFVGHSYGAALARAVWAQAMGGKIDGTAKLADAEPWAECVSRIVLLAAVARGWNQLAPMTTTVRLQSWAAGLIEVVFGDAFAMLDIRRGAPWITTTRLQTLSVMEALRDANRQPPIMVQLLGTVDDVVAPADNVDLATGAHFHYIEVPRTNHLDIISFDGPSGATRRELILTALVGDEKALDDYDIDAVDGGIATDDRRGPIQVNRDVSVVVFVVHGIRDYGYWTRKLAVRIKDLARNRRIRSRSVTSTYGFFPMGPFLILAERRKRAGWLRDQYVTARAMYPKADQFHFVGHSNGTYLLAAALRHCRAVRFNNIVFAGSVVRSDFGWDSLTKPQDGYLPQAKRVLNYVATADTVVATVPSAMRVVKEWDLGSAGHNGFVERDAVRNVEWVPGDHSAALQEQHWNEIADFVLDGEFPASDVREDETLPALKRRARRQGGLVRILGFIAPVVAVALAGAIIWALWSVWLLSSGIDWRVVAYSAASVAAFWLATRILTRV